MATNVRDPRSVITPEAFGVDPALLGTPLAAPWRRFWALMIDLVVIGVLTIITDSVALFVWGGVALFLISMAFRTRESGRSRDVTSILFRGATGCLGSIILLGVGIGFLARGFDGPSRDDIDDMTGIDVSVEGPGGDVSLGDVLGGVGGANRLRQATDTAEARQALERLAGTLSRSGMDSSDVGTALREFRDVVPDDADWREEYDVVVERVLAAAEVSDESEAPSDDEPLDAEIAALDDAAALEAYAALVAVDSLDPVQETRRRLLRDRLLPLVASDTLERLAELLDDARDDTEDVRDDLRVARERIEAGQGGFLGLLRDIWDQLGSAIGLWSVYFTVAVTVTHGRTVGKKLLGLRVLRLDGKPVTWWFAFERAGGYVAGIATGLLGFVQIFWDPNRQCVHDKIGGTVVVEDGAKPIPGAWEEAWQEQREAEG